MRGRAMVILALLPLTAMARSSFRASFRGGACSRGSGGGRALWYSRRTPHGHLSVCFGSGGIARGSTRGGRHPGIWPRQHPAAGSHPPCVVHRVCPPALGTLVGGTIVGGTAVLHGASAWPASGAATARAQPPPPIATRALPADLVDEGDRWFAREHFPRAVAAYRRAADRAPSDPLAAIALGHGLLACGDYEQAAVHLHRALALAPALARGRYNLAHLYARRAVFDAHVLRLSRHVAAHPGDGAAQFVLGYVAFATQQYGQARAYLAAAQSAFPQSAALIQEAVRRRRE